MGPWTLAVRPLWSLLVIVALLAGTPDGAAQGAIEGEIETTSALRLSGGVNWAAEDAVARLAVPGAEVMEVALGGVSAVVHTWTWNRTTVEAGPIRHEGDASFRSERVLVAGADRLTLDLGASSVVTIATNGGTLGVATRAADFLRAWSAHASVDPVYEARVPSEDVPYVHHMQDAVVVHTAAPSVLSLAGPVRIALWDAEVQIEGDNGRHRWEAGRSTAQADRSGAVHSVVHIKRVVWVDVDVTESFVRSEAPVAVYGGGESIDVDGMLRAVNATGDISGPGLDHLLLRGEIVMEGAMSILSMAGAGRTAGESLAHAEEPYMRSSWQLAGAPRTILVNGQAMGPGDSLAVETGHMALGVGLLVAAWAGLRFGPMVGAAVSTSAGSSVLRNKSRARVYDAVVSRPGAGAGLLADDAGLSRSTTKYHLRSLAAAGLVASYRDGKTLRYFENHAVWDRDGTIAAMLMRRRAFLIATAIIDRPGLDQASLSETTGLPRSTVSFHLQRLLQADAVRTERTGGQQMKHYHPTMRLHGVLDRLRRTSIRTTGRSDRGA